MFLVPVQGVLITVNVLLWLHQSRCAPIPLRMTCCIQTAAISCNHFFQIHSQMEVVKYSLLPIRNNHSKVQHFNPHPVKMFQTVNAFCPGACTYCTYKQNEQCVNPSVVRSNPSVSASVAIPTSEGQLPIPTDWGIWINFISIAGIDVNTKPVSSGIPATDSTHCADHIPSRALFGQYNVVTLSQTVSGNLPSFRECTWVQSFRDWGIHWKFFHVDWERRFWPSIQGNFPPSTCGCEGFE